jgi:hypothetical protein
MPKTATNIDDPDVSERERLRKLEQLMRERGYVRHAGGFWITPGSAPEEPGDNEDD